MEHNTDSGTLKKYLALLRLISAVENRLAWSELIYIFFNLIVLFITISLMFYLRINQSLFSSVLGLISSMLFVIVGETICIYWVISSMRIQLKLKLRYFQARAMERKMDSPGEYIVSEEYIFFDTNAKLESFDKKETVQYPTTGAIRMDGFAGSAKPRHLSWILPTLFFLIYCSLFLWNFLNIILL